MRARVSTETVPSLPGAGVPRRPAFSPISLGGQLAANREVARNNKDGASSVGSKSVSTAPHGGLLVSADGSKGVLDSGATADRRCDACLVKYGIPAEGAYAATESFSVGND